MNKFMKKVSVVMAVVLMISSMVISASAVSNNESTCAGGTTQTKVFSVTTNANSNVGVSSADVNALLGELRSDVSTVPTGSAASANVAGATGACPNGKVRQSAETSDATNAIGCNGGACTASANCSGSTCTKSNCITKTECISGSCAANAVDAASAGNADVSKCTILSGDSAKACTANSTFIDRMDSALAKCGLNIKSFCAGLSGGAKTAVTATPTSSANADTTATLTPSTDTGTTTTAPTDNTVTSDNASVDNQSFEAQVAKLVNEQRAANGLTPLTLSTELSNVARTKSRDMHDNNYFSHTSPTYGSPFDMLKSFGISYRAAGENIAMGYASPEAVVTAWMNSAGHRANILNASYTQIGVGYVADGNYWTQEFIG